MADTAARQIPGTLTHEDIEQQAVGATVYRHVAIVKPDHVGDLILAAPAISWISSQCESVVLFVSERNLSLARHLFPELKSAPIHLSYLEKSAARSDSGFFEEVRSIGEFDLTVFLRSDHLLNRECIGQVIPRCIFTDGRLDVHESINHRASVTPFFGSYVREEVWKNQNHAFCNSPANVGLCIGSGFPANKWSVIKWTALANSLAQKGISVSFIGGADEQAELEILTETAGLSERNLVIGGSDISGFLTKIREFDTVIASDGGSGHLCSLATSILTIAGSVPFRRFAPFGKGNRVISLDLPCSPCLNAHDTMANGCFSYECSFGIRVDDVLDALLAPDATPGTVRKLSQGGKLFYAPSHWN